MNSRERTTRLIEKDSDLYRDIEKYLAENIHPGHRAPLTIEKLVCGKGNFPLNHFVYLYVKDNQVYPNKVDEKWYSALKEIGRKKHSVFIALPINYSSPVQFIIQ
jgi:hypothetical protein